MKPIRTLLEWAYPRTQLEPNAAVQVGCQNKKEKSRTKECASYARSYTPQGTSHHSAKLALSLEKLAILTGKFSISHNLVYIPTPVVFSVGFVKFTSCIYIRKPPQVTVAMNPFNRKQHHARKEMKKVISIWCIVSRGLLIVLPTVNNLSARECLTDSHRFFWATRFL